MKFYLFYFFILAAISSCKNDKKDNRDSNIEKIETQIIEKRNEDLTKKNTDSSEFKNMIGSNCAHPEFFEFKNYKEYCMADTISIDLNGNGLIEKVYFDNKDCPKLIIKEKGEDLISIGCGKDKYKGLPNAIGWVNLWCVVSDKKTFEILVENGELLSEKSVSLERPSIYVGKEEAGGGIITYRNGKLSWIHQSD
ncbi:hypothetical protein QSV08_10825 [Maribacter sp. BPC-D8]|uniref:hypothetical protein n=1 Tax=Maribacter sp. BPC-D8 TaxID=3053613 RepID=UPI002B45D20A|nr:hypothetical protein [Maribacter sp. BPC-D8]WRI27719.1 hypothetical protein QSV08_10825 [Maribacter sp. BPC-D8]